MAPCFCPGATLCSGAPSLCPHKVTRVHHRALDCWRIETQSFLEKPGTRDDYEPSYFSIGYTCWQPGNDKYPQISMSAGVAYHQGKPVYDIDVDKVLLAPVLETLEIKELSAEAYAERVAAYEKRFRDNCKGRLRRAREQGTRNLGEGARGGYGPAATTHPPYAPWRPKLTVSVARVHDEIQGVRCGAR